MRIRTKLPSVATAIAVTTLSTFATAQTTTRISVDSTGNQANGKSAAWAVGTHWISQDASQVAFHSDATNLVAGDTNGFTDIFVRERVSGLITRVSVDSSGNQSNGKSWHPTISADGRIIGIWSEASNLVPGDTNGHWDAFVHDRVTGETTRVSVDSAGNQGNAGSNYPVLSADGRYVTFNGQASNLVAGDTNGQEDVFVHDRSTGATTRVSVSSTGAQANSWSWHPTISGDGRYVAFKSPASNLVPGDTNGTGDIFVHDRSTGATTRVSVSSSGVQGNGDSHCASISLDGQFVTFASLATNLVPGDTNDEWDVFVHDRATGATTRVSVDSMGTQGDQQSHIPQLSSDGRYVAFMSYASNLVAGDTNGAGDVFFHDRWTATTTRVSVDTFGNQGNSHSGHYPNTTADGLGVTISHDGNFVAFGSLATNLVPGDTNGCGDVFLHDRFGCGAVANYCLGAINTTGKGAAIGWYGSTSIAANAFTLTAIGCPAQKSGLFFFGVHPTQIPFGEGYLCVTGGQQRFSPLKTDTGGIASYTLDFTDPTSPASLITAGSTWNFQLWYRDPQPVGHGFNFTDALHAEFCP